MESLILSTILVWPLFWLEIRKSCSKDCLEIVCSISRN